MRQAARRTQARPASIPAPVKGLYEYLPVTKPDPLGAEWLENFLPTTRGLEVRGGISKAALVDDPVKTLFPFVESTSEFFAATADAIYDISSLVPGSTATQVASGMTSGDWSWQQVGIAGGNRLLLANGADLMQVYDGTQFAPLTDETVFALAYDGLSADFTIGETALGGTSGASAEILGLRRTTATTGTLYLGAVTSGPFQDDEALTSAGGSATVNGTITTANSAAITGIATDSLSHVWLFRNRIFMIEKDSLKAWYLPVSQIGGTALDLNLGGVFRRGGTLLFGATWSLDAGDGQDDKCVFVSTEGEIAVYEGTNPADDTTWNLVGRYDIPKPTAKRAAINAGGDLVIATKDGIVPLSAAMQKDPAALGLSAVTRPIERTWRDEVQRGFVDMELHKWTEQDALLVTLPDADRMLTANLETGAWGSQPGWYATCAGEYNGAFYIGRTDGRVYKINDTGTDDGNPFTAKVCFAFTDLGDPTAYKMPKLMRASFFASGNFNYSLGVASDYKVSFGSAPSAATEASGAMVWDVSSWNEATWGGTASDPRMGVVGKYRSVSGPGAAVAPTIQITSGGTTKLEVEVLSVDLIAETGGRAA